MTKYCMIETASNNIDEIDNIVKKLLDMKVVVSCHIIESESSWNYHQQREVSKEYLLQMTTKKEFQKKIYKVISSIHSYECFEFAVFDITSTSKDYLNWIDEELTNNNM